MFMSARSAKGEMRINELDPRLAKILRNKNQCKVSIAEISLLVVTIVYSVRINKEHFYVKEIIRVNMKQSQKHATDT